MLNNTDMLNFRKPKVQEYPLEYKNTPKNLITMVRISVLFKRIALNFRDFNSRKHENT